MSLMVVGSGCGDAADAHGIDGAAGFAPYPDIDHEAVARQIAPSYMSLASQKLGQLDVAPDGSIRLSRQGRPGDFRYQVVERYAPDGLLEARLDLRSDDRVVFHPDGELTEATPLAGGGTAYVRWSASFTELARFAVAGDDGATTSLPTYYRVADDGTFTSEPAIASRVAPRVAALVADRDGGFYAIESFTDPSGHHGSRLVRRDAGHAVVATAWLFPGAELPIRWRGTPIEVDGEVVTPILRYRLDDSQLLVDRRHRVWVVSSAPASAAAALGEFYGRPIDLRESTELFVLRFSASLELEAVVAVPAPNAQEFAMLAEGADGTIGIAALSAQKQDIGANKTTNYNTFFASLDPDGKLLGQRELDLDRDDWPHALAACEGGFCIAGETATTWVDTGSQVEFGQGFILAVGLDGNPIAQARLHGSRHNVIEALAPLEDGGVVFAGTTDGPITHTDPAELSSTALLGVLRL
jgi:hypothetical protein